MADGDKQTGTAFVFPSIPSSASSDSGNEPDDMADFTSDRPPLSSSPTKSLPRSPTRSLPKSPTKAHSPLKRGRSKSYVQDQRLVDYVSDQMPKGNIVHAPGARTIYTAGRPPWYNCEGELKEPFVIGLCGGSASGKTTVARMIIEALDVQWVGLISMDSFYKVLTPEQHELAGQNKYNFDHPDAFDFDLLIQTIKRLKEGKSVDVPVYNFSTHAREKHTKRVYGSNVVIVEGIMLFVNRDVLDVLDLKIFVDTDADIRLARRLKRDISERGRDIHGVLQQYNTFVKPAFDHSIAPTMKFADIVVPRGAENEVAVNLIVMHVNNQLKERGHHVRQELSLKHEPGTKLPDSVLLLPSSNQVRGLHTFIRNKDTSMDEFTFYSNRLMRLLIEYAMSFLPFKEVTVETPQGVDYIGKRLDAKGICGVSILRAGETLEPALLEVCKEIRIGKILIQTNLDTEEPELHYLRLPRDIKDCHVFLMDATVATGAAAIMAIRVLREHDVPEENIMLLSLLMAGPGAHAVAYSFPHVRIITSAMDLEINDQFHILPGIGNFGDRYFGTGPFSGADNSF